MDKKLKSCPFCGGVDTLCIATHDEIEERDATGCLTVVCARQIGGCGASNGYYETEEDAIEAWNIRVADKNLADTTNEIINEIESSACFYSDNGDLISVRHAIIIIKEYLLPEEELDV